MKAKEERHRTFAKHIVDGMSQSDAYRAVYPRSQKWKAQAVHNKAYELANSGEVKVMIAELKKEVLKEFVWEREASLKVLASIALSKSSKGSEKVSAIKELNVMCGYNAPSKMDLTSSDGSMSPKKDITEEELKATLEKYGIKTNE